MTKELEILELTITAHRVLLAALLANAVTTDETFGTLRERLINGKTAASIRTQYPDTGDAYFEEMERVLLMASVATKR